MDMDCQADVENSTAGAKMVRRGGSKERWRRKVAATKRNVSKGATKSVIEMNTGGGGRLVRGRRTGES